MVLCGLYLAGVASALYIIVQVHQVPCTPSYMHKLYIIQLCTVVLVLQYAIINQLFSFVYRLDYGCPDNCSGQGVCGNGNCSCDPGWTGTFCQLPVCPNNCSGNGLCDDSMKACNCSQGFTGECCTYCTYVEWCGMCTKSLLLFFIHVACVCFNVFSHYNRWLYDTPLHSTNTTLHVGADCSIDTSTTHWERVTTAPLPDTLTLSTLARGSHSAVVWGGYMLVYGGYRFPTQDYYYRAPANETMANDTQEVSILQYHFANKSWEEVKTYPSISMDGDAPSNNSTNGSMSDDQPGVPQPRYGHTAVVYNVSYTCV